MEPAEKVYGEVNSRMNLFASKFVAFVLAWSNRQFISFFLENGIRIWQAST